MSTRELRIGALACAGILTLLACPEPPPAEEPFTTTCETSAACPTGHVCANGICVIGACDPSLALPCDADDPLCCLPWQSCDEETRTCATDPDARGPGCAPEDVTCTPCEEDAHCASGQICSYLACTDSAGRESCVDRVDCARTERCDPNAHLCVPDRGGCSLCAELPALCCESDEVCSPRTDRCETDTAPLCLPDGTCSAGESCVGDRCVACVDDSACGPGLVCAVGAGQCVPSTSVCVSDADCTGAAVCTIEGRCVLPECLQDADCLPFDARARCELTTLRCVRPPAECEEDDEPNQSLVTATPIANDAYDGVLCRGDVDFLAFSVEPQRRYSVTVSLSGGLEPGVVASLVDSFGNTMMSSVFGTNSVVELVGFSPPDAASVWYVRVDGNGLGVDSTALEVAITSTPASPPPDCSAQPDEPNDTRATATPLEIGVEETLARCGTSDVDFYRFQVPALHGLAVIIDAFDATEGTLVARALDAEGSQIALSSQTENALVIAIPETPTGEVYLEVSLANTITAAPSQAYRVDSSLLPRPAGCEPDPTEDDGTLALAAPLVLSPDENGNPSVVADAVHCNDTDVDFMRFTLPAARGGSATLTFTHTEGDLRLALLDGTGAELATSNQSSSTNNAESLDLPVSDQDVELFVRVDRPSTLAPSIVGQRYALAIVTYDGAQCVASTAPNGDDPLAVSLCAGDFTATNELPCTNEGARLPLPIEPGGLASCASDTGDTPGCGFLCGDSDEDWLRVGPLANEQVLRASLSYDVEAGVLDLVRAQVNSTGTISQTVVRDIDRTGQLELRFLAPPGAAREAAIGVRPYLAAGHDLQPYALSIAVGPPCFEDAVDAAGADETPAQAVDVRPSPTPGVALDYQSTGASRCANDIDVVRLFVFAGETVSVALLADTSTGALVAEIGVGDTDLNAPALPVADPIGADGTPGVFVSPTSQLVFVTVKAAPEEWVTGPYTLTISTAGP